MSQVNTIGSPGRHASIEGRDCIVGDTLLFNVRDDYAFDVDETVWLDIEAYAKSGDVQLTVTYDDSGSSRARKTLQPTQTRSPWYSQSIPLERARFANLGLMGSDVALSSSSVNGAEPQPVTLCRLSLRRSYTTPVPGAFGRIDIEVRDEEGRATPARMGIYDSSGRAPLPSDEAIVLRNHHAFTGLARAITLDPRVDVPRWPVKNRTVFYTDGRYHGRLPPGEYQMVVAKGPEYRIAQRKFTVAPNQSQSIQVKMRRWVDMARNGWYSGEDHIHYARESAYDDRQLQLFVQAEDLRVANTLTVGNIASSYFPQYSWKPVSGEGRTTGFVLVPGQEDPRTNQRGHTLQLNIREPVRTAPQHYLLYHAAFEKVRGQGGLSGYAHLTERHRGGNAAVGLALDVPFGLVDFVEILSGPATAEPDAVWFDFLNLGFKLPPSAGTDYPYALIPGADRIYVNIEGAFSSQAWFDGLKRGRNFVTSGPMLELEVNGQIMGSELHVKKGEPLAICARSSINPDIDSLASVELIEQGKVIKEIHSRSGTSEVELNHEIQAAHGTWFVVRARGRNADTLAVSAPIYIIVDGQSFWKAQAVPSIVSRLKQQMKGFLERDQLEGIEAWETREIDSRYRKTQEAALKERVDQAIAVYDDLARRAAASLDRS